MKILDADRLRLGQKGITRTASANFALKLLELIQQPVQVALRRGRFGFAERLGQETTPLLVLDIEIRLEFLFARQQFGLDSLPYVGPVFHQGLQQSARPRPFAGLQRRGGIFPRAFSILEAHQKFDVSLVIRLHRRHRGNTQFRLGHALADRLDQLESPFDPHTGFIQLRCILEEPGYR